MSLPGDTLWLWHKEPCDHCGREFHFTRTQSRIRKELELCGECETQHRCEAEHETEVKKIEAQHKEQLKQIENRIWLTLVAVGVTRQTARETAKSIVHGDVDV